MGVLSEPILRNRLTKIKLIHEGQFTNLYRAEDVQISSRLVIIEEIQDYLSLEEQLNQHRRFTARKQLSDQLKSPYTVQIHELVYGSEYPNNSKDIYLILEYMKYGSLSDIKTSITDVEAAIIAYDIARAVKHHYDQDIVHCNIKPSKIFIVRNDENNTITGAKLSDYGYAQNIIKQSGIDAEKISTAYSSFEKAKYKYPQSISSDIHGIGMALQSTSIENINTNINKPTFNKPEYPALLSKIIRKSLETESQKTYSTPEEIIRDLEYIINNAPVYPNNITKIKDKFRDRKYKYTLILFLVIIIILIIYSMIINTSKPINVMEKTDSSIINTQRTHIPATIKYPSNINSTTIISVQTSSTITPKQTRTSQIPQPSVTHFASTPIPTSSRDLPTEIQFPRQTTEIMSPSSTSSQVTIAASPTLLPDTPTIAIYRAIPIDKAVDEAVQCGTQFQSTIWGNVRTYQGNPIPGALVRVISEDGKNSFSTTTDEKGQFSIPGLGCTNWTITLVNVPRIFASSGIRRTSIQVPKDIINGGQFSSYGISFRP